MHCITYSKMASESHGQRPFIDSSPVITMLYSEVIFKCITGTDNICPVMIGWRLSPLYPTFAMHCVPHSKMASESHGHRPFIDPSHVITMLYSEMIFLGITETSTSCPVMKGWRPSPLYSTFAMHCVSHSKMAAECRGLRVSIDPSHVITMLYSEMIFLGITETSTSCPVMKGWRPSPFCLTLAMHCIPLSKMASESHGQRLPIDTSHVINMLYSKDIFKNITDTNTVW